MTNYRHVLIAAVAIVAISVHLLLLATGPGATEQFGFLGRDWPLLFALFTGGTVLVLELLVKVFKAEFGSDLLAGISIVTSVLLGEYLAGTIVVLMLSGGESLEAYAVRRASLVLELLAN